MICLAVRASFARTFLVSAITSLLLAIAASIAALFSPSSLFFRTASVAKTLVTSASEVTCSKTFLSSWTGLTVSSASFVSFASFVSSTFSVDSVIFPTSTDSANTVINSLILASSVSTSSCSTISFEMTDFAESNSSLADVSTKSSIFFAVFTFSSSSVIFLTKSVLSTVLRATSFSFFIEFSGVFVSVEDSVFNVDVETSVVSAP